MKTYQNPLRSPDNDSRLQLLMGRIGTPIGEMVIVADHDGNLRATFWTDPRSTFAPGAAAVSMGDWSRLVIRAA